ncbi:hypothetical protein BS47DRAFT_1387168 [Hydnum rufescens UP504]|uniref:Chalcone isomerase domain-containing protein n=1 Tax=Hydnum rufescens UP504 TaxID=1448309 RepID=A0A9P6DZH7_9AGAM|nr:hypothetical protein BS47DRAFT_1387168 [Hydnum rufescens UP504]
MDSASNVPCANRLSYRNWLFMAAFRSNAILLGLLGGSASALFLYNTSHHTIRLDDPSNLGTRVDPATSIAFPTTLQPPSSPPLTLIGLGVRTVSFLSYKGVPESASFDERIDTIVKNVTCAIRIGKQSLAFENFGCISSFIKEYNTIVKEANALTLDQEQALEPPLQELKAVFPLTQLQKHTPLVVYSSPTKNPSDARSLIFEGLGDVKNTWIAEHFFKVYFTGKGLDKDCERGSGRYGASRQSQTWSSLKP